MIFAPNQNPKLAEPQQPFTTISNTARTDGNRSEQTAKQLRLMDKQKSSDNTQNTIMTERRMPSNIISDFTDVNLKGYG